LRIGEAEPGSPPLRRGASLGRRYPSLVVLVKKKEKGDVAQGKTIWLWNGLRVSIHHLTGRKEKKEGVARVWGEKGLISPYPSGMKSKVHCRSAYSHSSCLGKEGKGSPL